MLVEWNEDRTRCATGIGLDIQEQITLHVHRRRLEEDQDLYVRAGDFLQYGEVVHEIVGTSEPRQLFGQIENPIEISAKCFKARKGIFDGT